MSESLAAVVNVITAPFPILLLIVFAVAIFLDLHRQPHAHHFRKHMAGLWVCECGAARDHHGREVSRDY